MCEQNESNSFYLTTLYNNPETYGEAISLRHAGVPNWWKNLGGRRDLQEELFWRRRGRILLGQVSLVKWPKCFDLIATLRSDTGAERHFERPRGTGRNRRNGFFMNEML